MIMAVAGGYTRPHRPRAVRLLNVVGKYWPGTTPQHALDESSLLRAARVAAGLSDFGDEWFREPLAVLLDSMRREARLTPLGVIIQRNRIVSALVNRLRMVETLAQHPEIECMPLGHVVVIAGLQRTGTTLLHRLLAADPHARALQSWEALNPLPFPNEFDDAGAPRKAFARRAQRALEYLAPQFFAVHPVEFDAPEEDVLLLDMSFMSQSAEAMMHVPSYSDWLERQDHTRAYRDLRRTLQVLQFQRGGTHWVLKTPHHVEYLDVMTEVFRDLHIVATHRDPQKTLPSFCSMVAHGRGVLSDHVDPVEVGRHWLRKVRRMIDRAESTRLRIPEQFLEIAYARLVADPVRCVQDVYAFARLPWRAEVHEAVEVARQRARRDKYGVHAYDLRDFGLTSDVVDAAFADYVQRHDIERE